MVGAATALLALQLEPDARKALTAGGTSVPGAYERTSRAADTCSASIGASRTSTGDRVLRAVTAEPAYALAHTALGEAYWRKYEIDRQPAWIERAVATAGRRSASTTGSHRSTSRWR